MARKEFYPTTQYPKTLLLGIHAPYNPIKNIESYFQEFATLAKTNLIKNYETMFIKLRDIDTGFFLTKGKLEQVKEFCDQNDIEEVVFSEMLTSQQERNLADYLRCKIFDRSQLILEIFEKAAHSAEGKAQVQIALLQYQKSRLAGKGIHLAQQPGVRGMRGGYGETSKEKERRHIENTLLKLKRHLIQLQKNREVQRKQRLSSGVAHLCIVGYTNAGKSTLLNALTNSSVLVEDKPFATLDTTTRELYIDSKKTGIISDTVGFIQQLPPHLIEAFKSTLSELHYADLLLQVVDLSDENWEHHINVVHEILHGLGIEKDMIYVFNKIDKVKDSESLIGSLQKYQPQVLIQATHKETLLPLFEEINQWKAHYEKQTVTL